MRLFKSSIFRQYHNQQWARYGIFIFHMWHSQRTLTSINVVNVLCWKHRWRHRLQKSWKKRHELDWRNITRYCYYAHRIMSEQYPKEYLSIIHSKMDKTKTSIPRLHVKSKSVRGTNLGLSFSGVLKHGHNTWGFGHLSLPFVHMGSQFTSTSLAKWLGTLKTHTLICMVICLMRVEVQETHFQMHYFKTLFTQNVECTRMLSYL